MRSIRTLDDVFQGMYWLSFEQRMAIALALYADITLYKVIDLKWSDTLKSDWRIDFVLESIPLSSEVENVFYEKDILDNDVPMHSLQYIFGIATMWQQWNIFYENNKDSIPIETRNCFPLAFSQTQQ